jgi:hypothetical protein
MLLHRKNDSREAISRSLSRYGVPGATAGSCSIRNRKGALGENGSQRAFDARLEVPVAAAVLKNAVRRFNSAVATGRRYARRASVPMMVAAHGASAA